MAAWWQQLPLWAGLLQLQALLALQAPCRCALLDFWSSCHLQQKTSKEKVVQLLNVKIDLSLLRTGILEFVSSWLRSRPQLGKKPIGQHMMRAAHSNCLQASQSTPAGQLTAKAQRTPVTLFNPEVTESPLFSSENSAAMGLPPPAATAVAAAAAAAFRATRLPGGGGGGGGGPAGLAAVAAALAGAAFAAAAVAAADGGATAPAWNCEAGMPEAFH